jgi:hypothetical protein
MRMPDVDGPGRPYPEKPLSPDEMRQVVQQVLAGAGNGSE